MPYLIQKKSEQNQTIAKIHDHFHKMGGKVEETKEIAQTATAIAVISSQHCTGYAASPFPDAGFPADPNAAGFGSEPPPAMPAASANPFMVPQSQPMGGNVFPPQSGSANAFGNFPHHNSHHSKASKILKIILLGIFNDIFIYNINIYKQAADENKTSIVYSLFFKKEIDI